MSLCTTMNKLKNKSILLLAVLAMAIGSMSACHSDDKEKKEQQEEQEQQEAVENPTVEVVPVTKGRLSSAITIPGELLPYQQVDLYAKTNSYVKKLLVDIGSEVHTGQLLAVLEAPEVNSQVASAQSRIKQFEAVYYASKATYDRLLSTSKTPGTVSQNDLEQAEAKKNADLANVEAAKSGLKEVSANLGYLEIRAPFDGVVTSRNVNLGAYVGPGGKSTDPLFTVQDQNRMRLVVSVPEIYTGALSNKSEVNFTVRALPSEKFTAQVKRIAGALDEKLRAERLEMDVYNKSKKLLPHMFAEVSVPLPAADSAYVVPKTAVATSTEKVFIIKVVNNKAVWVDVKKGLTSGDSVEIFGGDLKPEDKLVKVASDEIRNGSNLKIKN
ncbi:RND family efflux transporter MFP subunit [Mucilaginibacter oryzae]|uniref:RND family efflux transporter MFP subunit n=2 Tax=Mucilaginibacter oryzae TaxID=468058 RepID=A0A316HBS0_9SPHI|nr:RND family efflux transporter MFP subunit [Mucilaginibacter oryzae]